MRSSTRTFMIIMVPRFVSVHNRPMALAELIGDPDAAVDDIAAVLDGLDHDGRWALLSRLGRGHQRALYRKAAAALDLAQLVPGAAPLTEVVHDGVNTLPVVAPLRRFQKRFCRPESGDCLYGYNEGPTRRLIGPGYFIATADPEGGVVVDYFQVPPGRVPDGWPRVIPNSHGLQRFVFHQTRDYLRRVSAHVSVGAAYRKDRPLDHYFVLCRRD
jgi:hypothetical protein